VDTSACAMVVPSAADSSRGSPAVDPDAAAVLAYGGAVSVSCSSRISPTISSRISRA